MGDSRPIGVFDSGVGGLTVLRALQDALPDESTIYFGDLARCPYGPRRQSQVREFSLEIGDALARFGIKLLVIACNTATAAAYADMRERYGHPVIGVIVPGAQEAVRLTQNRRIGVIATDGTVASGAYGLAIRSQMPDANVVERSASWLVPVIERGSLARPALRVRLAKTMLEMCSHDIDTLILGCTHFPIVRDIFEAGVAPRTAVLDSAHTTAREVTRLLRAHGIESTGTARHRILVTGPAEAFAELAQAMFRSSPEIEEVDMIANVVTGV